MPVPTSLVVSVDNNEYSRYEPGYSTITASITADGGAPYNGVPITVELVKARRTRSAVVHTEQAMLVSPVDPVMASVSFDLNDIVDQDALNLVRHGNYFVRARYEATRAVSQIGSGANGTVDIASAPGSEGNNYSIEVVIPTGTSPLAVLITGTAIQVSLATELGVVLGQENDAINVTALLNSELYTLGFTVSYRGNGSGYFSLAEPQKFFTGGTDEVVAVTKDFRVVLVTVERFRREWLFGIDLKSTVMLQSKFPLLNITGVEIIEISQDQPRGPFILSYTYNQAFVNASAFIGVGFGSVKVEAIDALKGLDGNSYTLSVIAPTGTSPLSAALVGNDLQVSLGVVGGVPAIGQNDTELLIDVINSVPNFKATAPNGGSVDLGSYVGTQDLVGGSTTTYRALSWNGGPPVPITSAKTTYVLRSGVGGPTGICSSSALANKNYIVVRVMNVNLLPTESVNDDVIIDHAVIDDEVLANFIEKAISIVENEMLNIFVEPTVVTTDRDPTTIQFSTGINFNTPIYIDPDYDVLGQPLTYYATQGSGWLHIRPPYYAIQRVDSLYGTIANTRVIDINLEWIQVATIGGFIQIVPYHQEMSFDYLGLVWVNSINGANEIPNFWRYTMVAGLRDCPPELLELIGKIAAINALTIAALAYRPGLGSMSLSRDGVSQSLSFTSQSQYGVYTGTIQAYKDWLEENKQALQAKYRGVRFRVL